MIFKNKTKILGLTLLLAIIILIIPIGTKTITGDSTFTGEESYYTARIVDQYKSTKTYDKDLLTDKPINFNVYYYLMSLAEESHKIVTKYLPILWGLLSLILLFLIMDKWGVDPDRNLYALIVVLVSPIFIYAFTVWTSEAFAIFMILLSGYLFIRNNYLSVLTIGLALLTSFTMAFAYLILLVAFTLTNKSSRKLLLSTIIGFIVIGALAIFFLNFNPLLGLTPEGASVSNLFVAFSAVKGYSLIMLVLATIGMHLSWKRSLTQSLILFVTALIFFGSIFYPELRVLVSFILAFFAGTTINFLIVKEWNIKKLKGITMLIIICILIFSAAVFEKNIVQQVSPDKADAIKYLSATDEEDIVLSAENNGFMIENIAKRQAYIDPNSYKFNDYNEKIENANKIYYSRNLEELETLLKEKQINHLMIDEEMRNGEVWNSDDEGILFLLENSESFIKLYDNKKVQIYRYIGEI